MPLDGAVLLECPLAWPADTVMISPSAGMGRLSPSQSLSAACTVLRSVMTCPPCAMYWLIWAALQTQTHFVLHTDWLWRAVICLQVAHEDMHEHSAAALGSSPFTGPSVPRKIYISVSPRARACEDSLLRQALACFESEQVTQGSVVG